MFDQRRFVLLGLSAAAHALAVAILMRAAAPVTAGMQLSSTPVSLYMSSGPAASPQPKAIDAPPVDKAATESPAPSDVAPVPMHVEMPPPSPAADLDAAETSVASLVAAAAAGAPTTVCRIDEWLQAGLRREPEVQAALSSIPGSARSVAGAIMLWDGRWIEGATRQGHGLAAIRSVLMAGVRAAPEPCRVEQQRGPTLLTLPDRGGTAVLAVGSGEWRWNELLASDAPTSTMIAHAQIR